MRAGFGCSRITVSPEDSLFGYAFRQEKLIPGNDGINDPLYARAIAFGERECPFILVSVDCGIIPTSTALSLRQEISNIAETSLENIIVCATHSHSTPMPFDAVGRVDPSWEIRIRNAVIDAALKARGLMFPCNIFFHRGVCSLGYNRRVIKDGKAFNCWGPQEWPDRIPENSSDPSFFVLLFRQSNGERRIVLWNAAVHPVTLGKTSKVVSADYPGIACSIIKKKEPDFDAIFTLGAAGNIHPWIATQEQVKGTELVADISANFVLLLSSAAFPVAERKIEALCSRAACGDKDIDVTIWHIADDLAIVALPVELFEETAIDIRNSTSKRLIICTLANGCLSYLPPRKAYSEGGYEVEIAKREGFDRDSADILVKHISILLNGGKDES